MFWGGLLTGVELLPVLVREAPLLLGRLPPSHRLEVARVGKEGCRLLKSVFKFIAGETIHKTRR